MSYYTGMGDYYSGKGDFLGIGGAIKKGLGLVGSVMPGPIGAAARFAGRIVGGSPTPSRPRGGIALPFAGAPPRIGGPTRGPSTAHPNLGGCGCGTGYHLDKKDGVKCVRNRKMNPANPKALARASNRMDKFVDLSKKAMKHTNYKVVSKSYKQNWRKPLKK